MNALPFGHLFAGSLWTPEGYHPNTIKTYYISPSPYPHTELMFGAFQFFFIIEFLVNYLKT